MNEPKDFIAAKKWMRFLESIPVGTSPWKIEDYRDFISLRTTASILTNRAAHGYTYSITQNTMDKTEYFVKKSIKK